MTEDYVPYWDFNDPKKEVRDSSTGAIASSGLLDLSDLSGKEEFWEVAISILNSLCNNYLCEEDERSEREMEMGPSERKGKALEKFVFELEKRLNDKIWGIYLFGSFAKGTAREGSDIDLLVVYSGIEERRFLEVVSKIGFNILMETEELIEVIPMLKEEYESSLGKSPFLWEVLRFGVPIFTRLKDTEWKLEFRDYLELAEEYLRYAQDALKENKLRLVIDFHCQKGIGEGAK